MLRAVLGNSYFLNGGGQEMEGARDLSVNKRDGGKNIILLRRLLLLSGAAGGTLNLRLRTHYDYNSIYIGTCCCRYINCMRLSATYSAAG